MGVQGGRLLGQMVAGWWPSQPLTLHRCEYLQELMEHLPTLKRMQSSRPSFAWVTVWVVDGVDVAPAGGPRRVRMAALRWMVSRKDCCSLGLRMVLSDAGWELAVAKHHTKRSSLTSSHR